MGSGPYDDYRNRLQGPREGYLRLHPSRRYHPISRTQRIPTRLDIGWAGDIYHAWVSVYVDDVGWINGIIQFDGHEWKRMDPTFADNGNQEEWIMDFIATDSNYNVLLVY